MLDKISTYIQNNPKRSFFYAILFVLFLIFLLFSKNYLTTGSLVVNTNAPTNLITVAKEGESEILESSTGSYSSRLQPGSYIVTVSYRTSSTKRTVEVKPRETSEYTINVENNTQPEFVLPEPATSVFVGNNRLLYLNSDNGLLFQLSPSGLSEAIAYNIDFDAILWKDESYGVGISKDGDSLYEIKNLSVNKINLPSTKPKQILFSLNSDGSLIYSDTVSVYVKEQGGSFNRIYTPKGYKIIDISSGGNNIFIRQASVSSIKENNEDQEVFDTLIISKKGSIVSENPEISADHIQMSPDGKKIVVTSESSSIVYNEKLEKIAQIADTDLASFAWKDSDHLLYGIENRMYSFGITDLESKQLFEVQPGGGISNIYPVKSSDLTYFLASNYVAPDSYSLMRLDVSGKLDRNPDFYKTLGMFFPAENDECSFSYNNFLKPVIQITAWRDKESCLLDAKAELRADDLPIDEFNIVFVEPLDL